MSHNKRVQRSLTHIPRSLLGLQGVWMGFAGSEQRRKCQLLDPNTTKSVFLRRIRPREVAFSSSRLPARWDRWTWQAWRRTGILCGSNKKGSRLTTAEVGVLVPSARRMKSSDEGCAQASASATAIPSQSGHARSPLASSPRVSGLGGDLDPSRESHSCPNHANCIKVRESQRRLCATVY